MGKSVAWNKEQNGKYNWELSLVSTKIDAKESSWKVPVFSFALNSLIELMFSAVYLAFII